MQLMRHVFLVGSGEVGISETLDCHVYLVDGGSECALIDAGSGGESSVSAIESTVDLHGLDPERISTLLLTHWHIDHANGASDMRDRYGCRVLAPSAERAFIAGGRDGLQPCVVDSSVEHGDTIRVGELQLTALTVPGHSEATTAYLLEVDGRRALLCGDVVFANGVIGLINYPGSDLQHYREHIGRLEGLRVDALLPGHGMFTLGHGQRHIDLAIRRLRDGMFVPPSIGQHSISYLPPAGFEDRKGR